MEPQEGSKRSLRSTYQSVPSRVKWLIYLSSFNGVGYGYAMILVTVFFATDEIGLKKDVGLLLGLMGLTSVATAVPIGLLADRRGRKWIIIFGLAAVPPALIVFGLTTDILYLVVASVVAGLAEGAFAASWNALIADQTDLSNRNAAFSLSFIVGTASFALGMALPFVFPLIEDWLGATTRQVHTGVMVILGLVSFISPILLWLLLKDYKEDLHPPAKLTLKGKSTGILLKFSGINGLIGLGAGFIIPLIPMWLLLKFDVPDSLSGPLLAVGSILMGAAALVSSALAHKYGMIRSIVLVQGLSTVFMFSLAFIPNAALAAGFYLIRAALMNMGVPLMDSFLMGIITKEERGLASAINSIFWRLPNSASTIVGGILLASGNYEAPFILATVFYVVSITLFYRTFKNVKPKS
jgi:MFS family permease